MGRFKWDGTPFFSSPSRWQNNSGRIPLDLSPRGELDQENTLHYDIGTQFDSCVRRCGTPGPLATDSTCIRRNIMVGGAAIAKKSLARNTFERAVHAQSPRTTPSRRGGELGDEKELTPFELVVP